MNTSMLYKVQTCTLSSVTESLLPYILFSWLGLAFQILNARTQSEMLPLTAQRDRLQKEKEMKDRMIDDLRKAPAVLTE